MKRALLRNMSSFSARKFLLSSTKSYAFNSILKQPSLAALSCSRLRFYSSDSHSTKDDNDYVSKEELKRRIQKYFDGDEEAMPSIFEGILSRKLSGKHEESDDELMKEIRKSPSHLSEEFETDED